MEYRCFYLTGLDNLITSNAIGIQTNGRVLSLDILRELLPQIPSDQIRELENEGYLRILPPEFQGDTEYKVTYVASSPITEFDTIIFYSGELNLGDLNYLEILGYSQFPTMGINTSNWYGDNSREILKISFRQKDSSQYIRSESDIDYRISSKNKFSAPKIFVEFNYKGDSEEVKTPSKALSSIRKQEDLVFGTRGDFGKSTGEPLEDGDQELHSSLGITGKDYRTFNGYQSPWGFMDIELDRLLNNPQLPEEGTLPFFSKAYISNEGKVSYDELYAKIDYFRIAKTSTWKSLTEAFLPEILYGMEGALGYGLRYMRFDFDNRELTTKVGDVEHVSKSGSDSVFVGIDYSLRGKFGRDLLISEISLPFYNYNILDYLKVMGVKETPTKEIAHVVEFSAENKNLISLLRIDKVRNLANRMVKIGRKLINKIPMEDSVVEFSNLECLAVLQIPTDRTKGITVFSVARGQELLEDPKEYNCKTVKDLVLALHQFSLSTGNPEDLNTPLLNAIQEITIFNGRLTWFKDNKIVLL